MITMPNTTSTWRYLQERAAKGDVHITVTPLRNSDHLVGAGKVAIMPRDEREAKYDRPEVLVNFGADGRMLCIIGGRRLYTGELAEMADEALHYGEYWDDNAPPHPPTDWQAVWHQLVDIARRRRLGRKTY